MKKIGFLLLLAIGLHFQANAQLFVDDVNINEDPDVKFLQVWMEGAGLNNFHYINASFGQRLKALNPDTRRLKDKKGKNIEVYGVADVFNIMDANGFDFVTIDISGSGSSGGGGLNNVGSNMSISTTYIFKRKEKKKE
jgi:hypothetical protein